MSTKHNYSTTDDTEKADHLRKNKVDVLRSMIRNAGFSGVWVVMANKEDLVYTLVTGQRPMTPAAPETVPAPPVTPANTAPESDGSNGETDAKPEEDGKDEPENEEDGKSNDGEQQQPEHSQDLLDKLLAQRIHPYLPVPENPVNEVAVFNAIKEYDKTVIIPREELLSVAASQSGAMQVVTHRLEMIVPEMEIATRELCHMSYPKLLRRCRGIRRNGVVVRRPVLMVGPAGSGKTTAAEHIAKDLNLPFFFNGAIDSEYKLRGFIDATGTYVSTPFYEAYKNGGVYLFDELDASMPGAILAFNAALANGHADFPEGVIPMHKDCIILAAANTFGNGATFDYVGRMKQDAAFIDRFVPLPWNIDTGLETKLAGNDEWVSVVRGVRTNVERLGIRHVVSPRASIYGAELLAMGDTKQDVVTDVIRKGLSKEEWDKVGADADAWANQVEA